MGKPFLQEMQQLASVYRWARSLDISALRSFVDASRSRPMLCVGAGGSWTAAKFAAQLHELDGGWATCKTPLEFRFTRSDLRGASVLLLSAAGKNEDILGAFDDAVEREAQETFCVCASRGSKLWQRATGKEMAGILEFDLPSGHDGFLATNSLLATMAILLRAYINPEKGSAYDLPEVLPALSDSLMASKTPAWRQDVKIQTWITLYSGWSSAAAADFESKCSEAALANVLLADYRNFGHGRHHWLDKRATTTAVLALVNPEDEQLSRQTLQLLPEEIPRLVIRSQLEGPSSTLDLLVQIYSLVAQLGLNQGIDPGRPGVPEFGSRIYNLGLPQKTVPSASTFSGHAAVERKGASVSYDERRQAWMVASNAIASREFGALCLDFDGTLCNPSARFEGVDPLLQRPLIDLVSSGVLLGIATGRGKSAREAMRDFLPRELWNRVIVGYYNGSQIAELVRDDIPMTGGTVDPDLKRLASELAANVTITSMIHVELRPQQLTVKSVDRRNEHWIHKTIEETIRRSSLNKLTLVVSSHSLDVLPKKVSKVAVVDACKQELMRNGNSEHVLRIGDRGAWPGNDFDLLDSEDGLSVDTVSTSLKGSWNLAPAGCRGVAATLFYLKSAVVANSNFKLVISEH